MVFNAMTLAVLLAAVVLIIGLVYWSMLSIGLQEAEDPEETKPEDMTEYEKRHVHRSDVPVK